MGAMDGWGMAWHGMAWRGCTTGSFWEHASHVGAIGRWPSQEAVPAARWESLGQLVARPTSSADSSLSARATGDRSPGAARGCHGGGPLSPMWRHGGASGDHVGPAPVGPESFALFFFALEVGAYVREGLV